MQFSHSCPKPSKHAYLGLNICFPFEGWPYAKGKRMGLSLLSVQHSIARLQRTVNSYPPRFSTQVPDSGSIQFFPYIDEISTQSGSMSHSSFRPIFYVPIVNLIEILNVKSGDMGRTYRYCVGEIEGHFCVEGHW